MTDEPEAAPVTSGPAESDVKVADHPNPWTVLSDGAKTVITLATGFLGITVTFAKEFVGDIGRGWVGAGWVCLALSIVANIYTIGRIQDRVRATRTAAVFGDKYALGFFNVSFVFLALGIVLVAVGAWVGWSETPAR
jgi:hypothetical protein